MRRPETLRSIARNLRKLAEDANAELAAQLLRLADEYDRMACEPAPRERMPCDLWEIEAA